MTEKQRAYLSKLHKFKFFYQGPHYNKLFEEVYEERTYWEALTDCEPTNKTLQLFKVYVDLRRKCCEYCGGTGFEHKTYVCSMCYPGDKGGPPYPGAGRG